MEGIVYRNANALLALTHAEGSAKLNLLTEIVFRNKILKLLYYLARTLNVAGATDTNRDFKHNILPLDIYFLFCGSGGNAFFTFPALRI
jgi:hypothetical protein